MKIIYRLGIVAIWLIAVFWVVFGGILFIQNDDKSAFFIAGGAVFIGVVAHLIWRLVLEQKKREDNV